MTGQGSYIGVPVAGVTHSNSPKYKKDFFIHGGTNMVVDITTKRTFNVDIEPEEAFRTLCKTLQMNFILEEDFEYFVTEDGYGGKAVYKTENGRDKCVDDRGDLFIALCNVAVNMFPNLDFRSADFIYENQ